MNKNKLMAALKATMASLILTMPLLTTAEDGAKGIDLAGKSIKADVEVSYDGMSDRIVDHYFPDWAKKLQGSFDPATLNAQTRARLSIAERKKECDRQASSGAPNPAYNCYSDHLEKTAELAAVKREDFKKALKNNSMAFNTLSVSCEHLPGVYAESSCLHDGLALMESDVKRRLKAIEGSNDSATLAKLLEPAESHTSIVAFERGCKTSSKNCQGGKGFEALEDFLEGTETPALEDFRARCKGAECQSLDALKKHMNKLTRNWAIQDFEESCREKNECGSAQAFRDAMSRNLEVLAGAEDYFKQYKAGLIFNSALMFECADQMNKAGSKKLEDACRSHPWSSVILDPLKSDEILAKHKLVASDPSAALGQLEYKKFVVTQPRNFTLNRFKIQMSDEELAPVRGEKPKSSKASIAK